MKIGKEYHLTYCTNIHAEKSLEALIETLQSVIPAVRDRVCEGQKFGIGLRLSDYACRELLDGNNLQKFKQWLGENGLYVFTLNGFPYGIFHGQKVKDDVHKPDWTTQERVEYSRRLSRILAVLLPEGMEGSISTSPLSYKPWFAEEQRRMATVFRNAAVNLAQAVEELLQIRRDTGKIIHIDLEPEPDGLLESSSEVVDFFNNKLMVHGVEHLVKKLSISPAVAEDALRTHLRICYDICHFSVNYETPREALDRMLEAGVRIGKIQISAALKVDFNEDAGRSQEILQTFEKLNDPIYLHQLRARDKNDEILSFPDLPEALKKGASGTREWRVHYHVPLFTDSFGLLTSTQKDIYEVFEYLKNKKICDHLEVETYTWEVLPSGLKSDLEQSIVRELEWVKACMESEVEANQENTIQPHA